VKKTLYLIPVLVVVIVLFGLILIQSKPRKDPNLYPPSNTPVPTKQKEKGLENNIQQAVEQVLEKEKGITGEVTVVDYEEVDWPDSSLGCPQPDMAYAQVITPGYKVIVEAEGKQYDVRINESSMNGIICE
jgi:hypothetical protein